MPDMPPRSRESFPSRYRNRWYARQRYGALADWYAGYYWQGDPLADDAVQALQAMGRGRGLRMFRETVERGGDPAGLPGAARRLLDVSRTLPDWVDRDKMRLGARTYQRLGVSSSLILSSFSLMNGYRSSAGVKPLVWTGQLDRMAPRRLAETGRFVVETIQEDGLLPGHAGWKITLHVRLMHAMVRQALRRSPEWRAADWGMPINQADMAGTVIEFSSLMLRGARQIGFQFTREEADAVMHLWCVSGWLSGVDPALLEHLSDERRAWHIAEMIDQIQPPADDDSVALAQALRGIFGAFALSPFDRWMAPLLQRYHDGLVWTFNAPEVASALEIPNRRWTTAVRGVSRVIRSTERLRRNLPGANRLWAAAGNRMLRDHIELLLEAREPDFVPRRVKGGDQRAVA